MAKPAYLVKSEPYKYSFEQLLEDGRTVWDGVRNYEARNTLRAMGRGDVVLYYHSNEGKEIVGVAKVARTAYQDPTTEEDWSVVELEPIERLARPIGLAELKAHPILSNMALVKRSRISVTPVTTAELETVLSLSRQPAPRAPSSAPRPDRSGARRAPVKAALAKAASGTAASANAARGKAAPKRAAKAKAGSKRPGRA